MRQLSAHRRVFTRLEHRLGQELAAATFAASVASTQYETGLGGDEVDEMSSGSEEAGP